MERELKAENQVWTWYYLTPVLGCRLRELELSFTSKEFRSLCLDPYAPGLEIDPELSRSIVDSLSDLRAAVSPLDLPPLGNPREVKVGEEWRYRVDLVSDYYIDLISNHLEAPLADDGHISWKDVYRVMLMGIYDDGGLKYG